VSRKRASALGVSSGERYALFPREILESASYLSLPDWCVRVLNALTVQYYGTRNGCLALPVEEAKRLGVRQPWRVYAGLRLLTMCDLAMCTRRGRLHRGGKLASLYALTWRGIDAPADGVIFDAGIGQCPLPSNAWARWQRPDDWDAQVTSICRRAQGKTAHACPYPAASPVTPRGGTDRTPRGGADVHAIAHPVAVRKRTAVAHPVVVTSKISGRGVDSSAPTPVRVPGRRSARPRVSTVIGAETR